MWTTYCGDSDTKRLERRTRDLNQLLSSNRIARTVRTLTLRMFYTCLKSSISGGLIASILHRVPNLRHFVLQAPRCYGGAAPFEFSLISKNLVSAIRVLLGSPNITRLEFLSLSDVPLALITACPNLQFLHSQQIECDYANTNVTSSPQGIYLHSLDVDTDSVVSLGRGIESHPSFAEYFSQLKNLKISNDNNGMLLLTYEGDLALLALQSLTRLEIRRHMYLMIPASLLNAAPYDLSRFPALRHFEIDLPVLPADNRLMLGFLNQLLTISSSTSHIETLKLKFSWYFKPFHEGDNRIDVLLPEAGWSTLDKTLTSGKFPFLTQVEITLLIDNVYHYDEYFNPSGNESIITYVDTLFPKFRALSNTLERPHLSTSVIFR